MYFVFLYLVAPILHFHDPTLFISSSSSSSLLLSLYVTSNMERIHGFVRSITGLLIFGYSLIVVSYSMLFQREIHILAIEEKELGG